MANLLIDSLLTLLRSYLRSGRLKGTYRVHQSIAQGGYCWSCYSFSLLHTKEYR